MGQHCHDPAYAPPLGGRLNDLWKHPLKHESIDFRLIDKDSTLGLSLIQLEHQANSSSAVPLGRHASAWVESRVLEPGANRKVLAVAFIKGLGAEKHNLPEATPLSFAPARICISWRPFCIPATILF